LVERIDPIAIRNRCRKFPLKKLGSEVVEIIEFAIDNRMPGRASASSFFFVSSEVEPKEIETNTRSLP
jgi:hypothetical protein